MYQNYLKSVYYQSGSSESIVQWCTNFLARLYEEQKPAAEEYLLTHHAVVKLVQEETSHLAARAWLRELNAKYGEDRISDVLKKGGKLQAELKQYEDTV